MNTDTLTAADGMRLTVSQVKRLCQSHELTTDDTQDALQSVLPAEDGTYDAREILEYLGY